MDIQRQAQLKYLAQQADERWEAKPRLVDLPPRPSPQLEKPVEERVETRDSQQYPAARPEETESKEERAAKRAQKENPWKSSSASSNEPWQPAAWTPGPARR